jgi:hypothetical protein
MMKPTIASKNGVNLERRGAIGGNHISYLFAGGFCSQSQNESWGAGVNGFE